MTPGEGHVRLDGLSSKDRSVIVGPIKSMERRNARGEVTDYEVGGITYITRGTTQLYGEGTIIFGIDTTKEGLPEQIDTWIQARFEENLMQQQRTREALHRHITGRTRSNG